MRVPQPRASRRAAGARLCLGQAALGSRRGTGTGTGTGALAAHERRVPARVYAVGAWPRAPPLPTTGGEKNTGRTTKKLKPPEAGAAVLGPSAYLGTKERRRRGGSAPPPPPPNRPVRGDRTRVGPRRCPGARLGPAWDGRAVRPGRLLPPINHRICHRDNYALPRAWCRVACFSSLRGEQSGCASLLQSHKPHCVPLRWRKCRFPPARRCYLSGPGCAPDSWFWRLYRLVPGHFCVFFFLSRAATPVLFLKSGPLTPRTRTAVNAMLGT